MPFVTMTRPALGQVASLGDLYDARTDTFSAISLFTKTPTPSAITSIDNHSSTIKYVHTESYKEKFDHFGISSQLSASVAAGMVSVGGSGRYLTTRRDTKLTVESSLIYNITTVIERVNFQLQDLNECLAFDTLKDDIATHVVADISWGSRNIVTVRQVISREDDANVMTGNLDVRLKSINVSAGGNLTKASSATVLDNSFDVTVEGDVVATDGSVPRDLAGVEAYIGNVPKYISATNGGKGKPLFYCLLSLSDLARLLKVQIAKDITLRELSSQCADRFVQAFDEIVSVRQDINDYRSLLWSHREYISQDDFCACTDALFKLRTSETRLREQYKKAISNVRAGKEDELILWEVLNDFKNSGISLNRLIKFDLRALKERFRVITGVVAMGAKYIGYNNETLAHELGSTRDVDIFVFSFTEAAWRGSENWAKIILILHQLLHEEGASSRILIRDCDATGETLDRPKIELYRNAEMLNENILEQLGKPRARYRLEKRDRSAHKPVSRIPVSIPCPGQHCTLECKHDWICSRCTSRIEYGLVDDYLYCDCGRCHYRYWDFRCPGPKHGPDFTRFEDQTLHILLEGLEAIKQCNILILGRTGVGKSTWINSLVNYLTYSTLDSALEADSLTEVIPSAFTTNMTKSNGEYELIKVQFGFDSQSMDIPAIHRGNVDEHDSSTEQSATQRTNEHCIQMDDCEVRLIDTPGIGDTRRVSRDKENMADILSFLQSYPKLHGILILLKPNDQKSDLMFKFYMQELLTHLHRDAAKNIAFAFTNTRGTNYQPGDSFGALNQLLSKFSDVDIALRGHNVYSFDSESFRHLAARKLHGQLLGSPEENSRSWQHSVKESKRLIKYFRDLEPCHVTSSISLYATRNCIVKLTEAMASIAQAIRGSMDLAENELRSLEQCKADRKKLEQLRKRKTLSISASPLDKPKTTCRHDDCISRVGTGSKGRDGKEVLVIVYKSTCHSPCGLTGAKVDNIGNANLRGCAAMNSVGRCTVCGHDWRLHLRVNYVQMEQMVEIDDPTILSQLDANSSFADTIRTPLEAKQTYIRELEEELHTVTSAAAQLSNFLKRNAIMPYNDATLDYLDRSIQDEKEKVALGGSQDPLDRLEQYRKQYEQQVKVLDEHIVNGENSKLLDQAGVTELVKKLHGLPHYGRNLKDIGIVIDRIQYPELRETRRVFQPKPHDPKKIRERKDQQEVVASRGSRWAPEPV